MTDGQRGFVYLGVGCGTHDPAHRGRLTDVVGLADKRQYRTGDLGERHEVTVDHEATGDHAVVGHELTQQFGDRRTGPRDPAVGLEKPALILAWQKRLAVVETAEEVDAAAYGLDRIE